MPPTLGDQAHIRPHSHVNSRSPIEDQVVAVYETARKLARTNRFKVHIHNGPYGPRRGVAGEMVMKRLMKQLFPDYNDRDFETAYSIISQALRKTDAAVCIHRPDQKHKTPTWFISDTMPGNLVVVTLAQAKKSADPQSTPSRFDEKAFLTPRERRLSAEEVGETQPPGEITVTTKPLPDGFVEAQQKKAAEHTQIVNRVLEEIQTSPVPYAAVELTAVINKSEAWGYDKSTYRDALRELVHEGKIVSRKETRDEARVRGGGQIPRATRPQLYWPAPGPVPTRTQLPAGIEPVASAIDQVTAERTALDQDKAAVLKFIQTEPRDQRRRLHMTRTLGITDSRLTQVLRALLNSGEIYENQGRYYIGKSKTDRSTKTVESEHGMSLPSAPPVDTVQTAPSPVGTIGAEDGDQVSSLELVLNLANKLGVTLPKGDEARISELEAENAKLREQVAALKAAIVALG